MPRRFPSDNRDLSAPPRRAMNPEAKGTLALPLLKLCLHYYSDCGIFPPGQYRWTLSDQSVRFEANPSLSALECILTKNGSVTPVECILAKQRI